MRKTIPPCLWFLVFLPVSSWAQQGDSTANPDEAGAPDQQTGAVAEAKPAKKYFRFEFKTHPAIRLGQWFRMDLRLKFQHDFRTFDPEVSTDEGELSNLRKFRVGVEGYITKSL